MSSERAVDQLIKLSKIIGLSTFTIGFVVASLGSDLPEIINSLISVYLGHGDISVGDSMIILRKFAEQRVVLDESIELETEPRENLPKILGWMAAGFAGIGVGSYIVIESSIAISRYFGISEYIISFFLVSLGTSLPELVVEVSAIRKQHFAWQ